MTESMHAKKPETSDGGLSARHLDEEDQARVDAFLKSGVNSVKRKPFRPLVLIIVLLLVVTGFSLLSQGIALWAGVY